MGTDVVTSAAEMCDGEPPVAVQRRNAFPSRGGFQALLSEGLVRFGKQLAEPHQPRCDDITLVAEKVAEAAGMRVEQAATVALRRKWAFVTRFGEGMLRIRCAPFWNGAAPVIGHLFEDEFERIRIMDGDSTFGDGS